VYFLNNRFIWIIAAALLFWFGFVLIIFVLAAMRSLGFISFFEPFSDVLIMGPITAIIITIPLTVFGLLSTIPKVRPKGLRPGIVWYGLAVGACSFGLMFFLDSIENYFTPDSIWSLAIPGLIFGLVFGVFVRLIIGYRGFH